MATWGAHYSRVDAAWDQSVTDRAIAHPITLVDHYGQPIKIGGRATLAPEISAEAANCQRIMDSVYNLNTLVGRSLYD